MAQDEFKDVNLTINVKNFPGRKRCPYCNEMPEEIEWSSLGLRMWCRNPNCSNNYKIFVSIPIEELDLVKKTKETIENWGKFCKNAKIMKAW